jgi:4'-phosphopantetheinyl transferase
VEIVSGKNGKPRLASDEVHFNATHSGDLVAVAVAGSEVGVDAELLRPMRDALAIGERFFSAAEVERLRAADDVDAEFFSIWTMKEAVVKGIGKGITAPLQSFTVPREAHSLTPVASESELFRGWYVMALPAPGGYRAAVATRDGGARVEVLSAEC